MDRGHDSANSYSENFFQCTFVSWQSPQPLIYKGTCQKICQQRLYWCYAAIQTDHSKDHCINSLFLHIQCVPFPNNISLNACRSITFFVPAPMGSLWVDCQPKCSSCFPVQVHPIFFSWVTAPALPHWHENLSQRKTRSIPLGAFLLCCKPVCSAASSLKWRRDILE